MLDSDFISAKKMENDYLQNFINSCSLLVLNKYDVSTNINSKLNIHFFYTPVAEISCYDLVEAKDNNDPIYKIISSYELKHKDWSNFMGLIRKDNFEYYDNQKLFEYSLPSQQYTHLFVNKKNKKSFPDLTKIILDLNLIYGFFELLELEIASFIHDPSSNNYDSVNQALGKIPANLEWSDLSQIKEIIKEKAESKNIPTTKI